MTGTYMTYAASHAQQRASRVQSSAVLRYGATRYPVLTIVSPHHAISAPHITWLRTSTELVYGHAVCGTDTAYGGTRFPPYRPTRSLCDVRYWRRPPVLPCYAFAMRCPTLKQATHSLRDVRYCLKLPNCAFAMQCSAMAPQTLQQTFQRRRGPRKVTAKSKAENHAKIENSSRIWIAPLRHFWRAMKSCSWHKVYWKVCVSSAHSAHTVRWLLALDFTPCQIKSKSPRAWYKVYWQCGALLLIPRFVIVLRHRYAMSGTDGAYAVTEDAREDDG
eukprot:3941741-Rhodomonas_salina.2